MVDGIELVDGILDVLAQVLVLKDKREVEEVEEQHGCSVEKRVAPGNEIGRERYGTRRHAHEHHDDGGRGRALSPKQASSVTHRAR